MNAFFLLGVPILEKLRGGGSSTVRVGAKLTASWKARRRFQNFTKVVYVRLVEENAELKAEPLLAETESITILTKATGYVVVPEHITQLSRGSQVEVNLVPGFSYA